MLVRFAKWFVVAALVLTLGGHWAFLQVVAWTGMAVSYSQAGGFTDGLVKTFDGKHPCKLCKLVSAGKNAQKKSETKFEIKKLESFFGQASVFYFPPLPQPAFENVAEIFPLNSAPLSPPPRSA